MPKQISHTDLLIDAEHWDRLADGFSFSSPVSQRLRGLAQRARAIAQTSDLIS